MIVKYRKSFFEDINKIKNFEYVEVIEFVTEFANNCKQAKDIPGYKDLRQYPGKARIEEHPIALV